MSAKERRFWGDFLDLYRSMPCLWKVKSADYSNRRLKHKCYDKMVEKLSQIDPEASREKVVKKINVFRTNYKRALKKGHNGEKSDTSTLWYFNKLRFLEGQDCSRDDNDTMDSENFKIESVSHAFEKQPSPSPPSPAPAQPPPAKKPRVTADDDLLEIACQKLTNTDSAATAVFAQGWEAQYNELSQKQKVFARMIFADVLFHGCLNKLTEETVEDIHKVLQGVSTQYIQEYTTDATHFEEQLFSPPPNDE